MPEFAWADGNLAELTGHLTNIIQMQVNPTQVSDQMKRLVEREAQPNSESGTDIINNVSFSFLHFGNGGGGMWVVGFPKRALYARILPSLGSLSPSSLVQSWRGKMD